MRQTVARAIATQIEAQGVERVYQVPGESFLGLLNALRDSPVRLVTARNEGGAAFMALAEGRLTGRAGVCAVTRGPGAANAAIGVHTAFQDGTPVVLFVGLVPTDSRDLGSFQEFDPRAWFGSTSKAVFVLDNPETAAERVARAFAIAESGKPGPVIIGLPEELLARSVDEWKPLAAQRRARVSVSSEESARIAGLIQAAERPVFVLGGDSWDERASAGLRTYAEHWSVPVVSDFRAQDTFPHSSQAWVGSLGYGRSVSAATAYDDADLVVYLGTARKDVLSDGYRLGSGASRVLVVSPDPELMEHTGRLDQHYVMYPGDWIESLQGQDPQGPDAGSDAEIRGQAEHRGARGDGQAGRQTRLSGLREAYLEWSRPQKDCLEGSDEEWRSVVFGALQDQLPANSVVTLGAGNYAIGALRYLHREVPKTFVGPRNGAMGMGVPAAVAAALVHPERTVVALAGDGCFGMNGQELATLAAAGAKAILILLDNGGFGTIRSHQEREFPDRPSGTFLENPDYCGIARAHGIDACEVTAPGEFPAALANALSSDSSVLMHLRLPAVALGTGQHDGTGLTVR